MSETNEFRVGDVVDVAGMRGIIRVERNGRFLVSAGRTDEGIWVDFADMASVYRSDDEPAYHVGSCDNDDCNVIMFRWTEFNQCPGCGRWAHVKGEGKDD